jgi:hypothetical protein
MTVTAPTCLKLLYPVLLACLPQVWFHNVLKDAMAAQLAGSFIPLKEWGAYHIELLLKEHGVQTGYASNLQDLVHQGHFGWCSTAG